MQKATEKTYIYLAEKYGDKAIAYTEYPYKSFWSHEIGDADFRVALKNLLLTRKSTPLILYLHIPFCQQLCYFCVCHTHITDDYERVKRYLGYLCIEINLLRDFFGEIGVTPNFQEIFLGGGSPTYLREKEFDSLVDRIKSIVDLGKIREFTIEIDPRRVNQEKMIFYHSRGINRISIGVQDFDPKVQEAVNRIQPAELTEKLLAPHIRKLFGNGVNLDIICGLPGQTRNSFRKTIEKVIELSPERVSLTFLTLDPKKIKHQSMMTEKMVPKPYERKMLFLDALEILLANGYIRMGYDHFAKSDDLAARARQEKKMVWNSFGYTPGVCVDIIGLGVPSYSTVGPRNYFQNTYNQLEYELRVSEGIFPIFRGHILNDDDVIRREVIQTLRGYFSLYYREIEEKYKIDFRKYFEKELAILDGFAADGLVDLSINAIAITELGRQFANQVCKVFDIYT